MIIAMPSVYVKTNGVWVPSSDIYVKRNGAWVQETASSFQSIVTDNICFKGEEAIMVENMLPEFVQANWVLDNGLQTVNPSYPVSNYASESVKPTGNVMVMLTPTSVSECYLYPVQSSWPYLTIGHSYYFRWLCRKESVVERGSGANPNYISEDLYWPEMENAIVRSVNNSYNSLWKFQGFIKKLEQSQWPSTTVQNSNYKIRFDCNNQKCKIKHICYADFMLIDLTKTYTNNGLPVPSVNELNAKRYFHGVKRLDEWT